MSTFTSGFSRIASTLSSPPSDGPSSSISSTSAAALAVMFVTICIWTLSDSVTALSLLAPPANAVAMVSMVSITASGISLLALAFSDTDSRIPDASAMVPLTAAASSSPSSCLSASVRSFEPDSVAMASDSPVCMAAFCSSF